AAYRDAYAEWQTAHRTLVDALFGESPDIKAQHETAAARLVALKAALPAPVADRLQLLIDEYARAAALAGEGSSARRIINQFRFVGGEIEKGFAPDVLDPPQRASDPAALPAAGR
ncbi:MAG: hypothetical protein HZA54_13180, partial [Planctomycetes bacterium]|nr:hypothetical protein [Planctomycetota bacterium]